MRKLELIKNGIFGENPVLRLVLGTCPVLAVSITAMGGVGMGIASTIVLIISNMLISSLRKVIPDTVRIPAYITIIAGAVTAIQMLVKAFVPVLDNLLGIYLPLIVVNCIILGRAEMFASKNTVVDSFFDALGMGLGFTAALFFMSSLRELVGSGTWFGLRIIPEAYTIGIMTLPPGGFLLYGCIIALLTALLAKRGKKLMVQNHCMNCQDCAGCEEVSKI